VDDVLPNCAFVTTIGSCNSQLPKEQSSDAMDKLVDDGADDMTRRLGAIEERLVAIDEHLAAVGVSNQQLLEQVEALRQGQLRHDAAVEKLEREVRRGRWLRWIGNTIRLLIWLAIIGALLYLFYEWQDYLQFL
jgi:hypothetical protein